MKLSAVRIRVTLPAKTGPANPPQRRNYLLLHAYKTLPDREGRSGFRAAHFRAYRDHASFRAAPNFTREPRDGRHLTVPPRSRNQTGPGYYTGEARRHRHRTRKPRPADGPGLSGAGGKPVFIRHGRGDRRATITEAWADASSALLGARVRRGYFRRESYTC